MGGWIVELVSRCWFSIAFDGGEKIVKSMY